MLTVVEAAPNGQSGIISALLERCIFSPLDFRLFHTWLVKCATGAEDVC